MTATARRSEHAPLRLTLPLPPVALSPNARRHWREQRRAVAAYRNRVEMEARRIPASQRHQWVHAEIQPTYYHPHHRKRDGDNFGAMLKPATDGLVRAGVLYDDTFVRHLPPRFVVQRGCTPRVELEIRPVGPHVLHYIPLLAPPTDSRAGEPADTEGGR